MTVAKGPLVLLILDGFGYSDSQEHNAIHNANSPTWDALVKERANTLIATSGMAVGLPDGQMGNSEVGHMTLGAGRVVYQNYTRINKAIADGDFFNNPSYTQAIDKTVANGGAVHIMGLLSPGGVHSHEAHMNAAIELAAQRGAKEIYLHAFLDGRDVPPRSAEPSLQASDTLLREKGLGRIASVSGRFFGMDRDNRWDRVQQAYDLMTLGKAEYRYADPINALQAAYARDEDDEFVKASVIADDQEQPATINDGDCLLFMNFRPDRARQITRAFVDDGFDGFEREARPALADFVMTTEYAADIPASCAFPPQNLVNSFGEIMAKQGKQQLRIAETEKYAHVTFFFSGGQEELFDGECRELIPSPDVETYDQKPEMSAPEVTEKLTAAIESGKYDVIICNYANCDQVGHTGDYHAAMKAVEVVDECLAKVFASIDASGGEALVTADHGNVETMFDTESGQKHTQHTTLPVPFVYYGQRDIRLAEGGSLADVAPTMLALMGIDQPSEMDGNNLAILAAH
ncbi:2,3-bisphosphoglycerate-independent phosphoglycerate mutase [Pseudoteredinibacter isoporae]|uniref:2,3-bisphosphoglycerate-independent phosphoglycerate mutase n=1 Tax=Pseudoteredinibacter isoporae TaxID=570281 RepID=A0A7X0JR55_9GAMM|nr:2,3-bisphosphoglycerate-independent phosphoglycerate mutase [Pseudoteredinibacter isoporae]MBB6519866.1 2,3-bisphosphoglycerate-independent phosphoglycerate mutase [Pseudoteredinibacter isoporae]NHO85444.1 2,3-bisphosphoglycerate-independent phosphoglycerate mutase [Pseudoteredinibacter isoporae]NIB26104.1 2,3-bisphosphoglycerate-independent phosphoglycerate mutase [Pseudoteredinibacter isoporae]